jgi:predicted nuclease of predicted toxin-antitoxin system
VAILLARDGHLGVSVRDAGFSGKTDGELLSLTEKSFHVFVTIDKNIGDQQNFAIRKIAVLIIRAASNDPDDIRSQIPAALTALRSIKPGQLLEVGTL